MYLIFIDYVIPPKGNIKKMALDLIKQNIKVCERVKRVPSIQVSKFIQLYEQSKWKDIQQNIQRTFQDENIFTLNFMIGQNTRQYPTNQNSLLDHQGVRLFIQKCKQNQNTTNIIKQCIVQFYNKIKLLSNFNSRIKINDYFKSLNQFRIILLIIAMSVFLDFSNDLNINILGSIIQVMYYIPTDIKSSLNKWLDFLSNQQLIKLIQRTHLQLNHQLHDLVQFQQFNPKADIKTIKTCQFFSLLNEFNLKFQKIPIAYFYNKKASSLNPSNQFKKWYKAKYNKNILNPDYNELRILNYSFLLQPHYKAQLLYKESEMEQKMTQRDQLIRSDLGGVVSYPEFINVAFLIFQIDRNNIVQDAIKSIDKTKNFKKPLKIKFKGEKGIDQGGVKKQFFNKVGKILFDINFGMFVQRNNGRLLWLNSKSWQAPVMFELVGSLLALAIYNNINIQIRLSPIIYKRLLKQKLKITDMKLLDEQIYNSLKFILETQSDVEQLELYFCKSVQFMGQKSIQRFIEDGQNIKVTNANKQKYVDAYLDFQFYKSIEKQFASFSKGFYKVLNGDIIFKFHYQEIEQLICGSSELNYQDLQKKTEYEGFQKFDPYIRQKCLTSSFWKILKQEFSDEEKRKFLFFCTGCDRAPINGLSSLNFTVQKNGGDSERLPSASTCFNILLLPYYNSVQKLKKKLKKAIEYSQGFGLP